MITVLVAIRHISRRDFHIIRSVHCELNYIISTNRCTILGIVYLILICSYIFRRDHHLQGAYINVVKTYSDKFVLQLSYISNVQF